MLTGQGRGANRVSGKGLQTGPPLRGRGKHKSVGVVAGHVHQYIDLSHSMTQIPRCKNGCSRPYWRPVWFFKKSQSIRGSNPANDQLFRLTE